MSAELRRLGFKRAEIQLTRMGTTYHHPDAPGALFTFGKHGPAVSCVGLSRYFPGLRAALGFTASDALLSVPGINDGSGAHARTGLGVDPGNGGAHATQREVLLRVARALSAQLAAGEE
jgi:hypothetical protein